VIQALKKYQASNIVANVYGFSDLKRIRSDAGSQFTSEEFSNFCIEAGIRLNLAAPKKQYQNHLAERTWQTISGMARALLIHARLPDTFWYHAVVYATHIFNVLPVRGIKNKEDVPTTPYELFFNNKP
jgi:transposase InsO family protein